MEVLNWGKNTVTGRSWEFERKSSTVIYTQGKSRERKFKCSEFPAVLRK